MMKRPILFLALLATSLAGFSQVLRECGNTEHDHWLRENSAEYVEQREWIEEFTRRYKEKNLMNEGSRASTVITIPCVVHVVYENDDENISDAQVLSQIDVLNEDLRRLNADAADTPDDFDAVAADFELEFCLATLDPDGNPTDGIIRVATTESSFGLSDNVKFTSMGGSDAWPADEYLNIWSCDLGAGLLGYAQFPGGADATDGVVITYSSFGREGFVLEPYDLGRTGTHEVGHWLNLFHIWGDDFDCSGSDMVDDTPNQEGANYGCPSYPFADACNLSVMYMNYMDYVDDACYNMFSEGQKERARALFEPGGARFDLGNSAKCVYYNNDAATVEILSPTGTYCYSTFSPIVTISNNGLETMTSVDINYSIDGATPITYYWTGSLPTGGSEDVTLPSISLGDGAHVLTITVSNPNGMPDEFAENNEASSDFFINTFGLTLPLIQGFEVDPFPYSGYSVINPDGSFTWERTTAASSLGGASIFMNHFENTAVGSVDELELPAYNMTGIEAAHLDFDVAYAVYTPGGEYSDTLEVLVSDDCGETWNSVYYKAWPDLPTSGATGSPFVPANDQWRFESVSLTPYIGDKLIVKFRTVSSWQNNLYIDNINIASGSVGIADFDASALLEVYPNPADNWLNISYSFDYGSEINMEIIDLSGQMVQRDALRNTPGQTSQTSVLIGGLAPGIYIIRLQGDRGYTYSSFVKN